MTPTLMNPTPMPVSLTTPKLTTPKLTTPKLTTPKLTTPKLTTPKLTTPVTMARISRISQTLVPLLLSHQRNFPFRRIGTRSVASAMRSSPARHVTGPSFAPQDAIVGTDLQGFVTSWNRGAEALFGYTAPEIIDRSLRTLIPEDLWTEESLILAKLQRGERIEALETTRIAKDGHLIEVSVVASPIRDQRGSTIGAARIIRDIRVLKERERESIRMRRLYDALSQVNQSIVWTRAPQELFDRVCRVLVEHGRFPLWHVRLQRFGFRALASFPICQGEVIRGSLSVCTDESDFFHEQEIALLDEAAKDISFALENFARDEA